MKRERESKAVPAAALGGGRAVQTWTEQECAQIHPAKTTAETDNLKNPESVASNHPGDSRLLQSVVAVQRCWRCLRHAFLFKRSSNHSLRFSCWTPTTSNNTQRVSRRPSSPASRASRPALAEAPGRPGDKLAVVVSPLPVDSSANLIIRSGFAIASHCFTERQSSTRSSKETAIGMGLK